MTLSWQGLSWEETFGLFLSSVVCGAIGIILDGEATDCGGTHGCLKYTTGAKLFNYLSVALAAAASFYSKPLTLKELGRVISESNPEDRAHLRDFILNRTNPSPTENTFFIPRTDF